MGTEYLKTIHGMISALQIGIGFAAIFACSFIWENSDVFFQFFWGDFPAQIYVFFVLFITWAAVIAVVLLEVSGRELLESLGKLKLIVFHGICFALMLIAAILDSHYLSTPDGKLSYHARLIVVTIFSWVLVATYIAQIVYVFFQ